MVDVTILFGDDAPDDHVAGPSLTPPMAFPFSGPTAGRLDEAARRPLTGENSTVLYVQCPKKRVDESWSRISFTGSLSSSGTSARGEGCTTTSIGRLSP